MIKASGYIKNWKGNLIYGLFDHGLISGSNFFINILLVRYFSQTLYGSFSVVYTIYLLILGLNTSFILEPLNIIGSESSRDRSEYFYYIVFSQTIISIFGSILLIILYIIFFGNILSLEEGIVGLSISLPFMLNFILIRRLCYLYLMSKYAFVGSVVYSITLILAFCPLFYLHYLTIFNVFILYGASSLISFFALFFFLKRKTSLLRTKISRRKVICFVKEHWHLGKWMLASSIISWTANYVYVPIMALFNDLGSAGSFKALDNLFLPIDQVITSLSIIIIPIFAQRRHRGRDYIIKIMKVLLLSGFALVFAYTGLIVLFGKEVVEILYGQNSYYKNIVWLIPLFSIPYFVRALSDFGLGITFRVVERFDILFKSTTFSTIFTILIGIVLVVKMNILGAALGKSVTSLGLLIISCVYCYKLFFSQKKI